MARLYRLMPWDMERLTVREVRLINEELKQMAKARGPRG